MSFLRSKTPIYLKGISAHLPDRVVDNEEIVRWLGAKVRASWIERRTGIRERRWAAPSEACSDLAIRAAEKVFSSLPETARAAVRQVVLGTVSGDYVTPPTSPLLQEKLGLSECGAFDLGAACAGFITGLHIASALAGATESDHLLVCSEIRSRVLSPEEFGTAVLFGDGAAGLVVSVDPVAAQFRFVGSLLGADGGAFDLIKIAVGGSRTPFTRETPEIDTRLRMGDGASVFLKAVHAMTELPENLLARLSLGFGDVRWIVPHQANLLLLEEIGRRIPGSPGKIVETVRTTGNTSGASVGIALAKLLENPELQVGDRVLLVSAGGGGLAACALIERV